MKIDVHQHLWTESLVLALQARTELPFVRREHGLTVLYLAGERPFVIDLRSEAPDRRAELVHRDGLDRALVCISSPLGIEALAREQSAGLLDAYHAAALSLEEPFGVWGAITLDRPDPDDVDAVLDRGCVGLSLPAGSLGSCDGLALLRAVLARLEARDAPLLVHPGPGHAPRFSRGVGEIALGDPLWWSALTRYVADMHAAWLAFVSVGRAQHPRLRVIFAMLAGLAPLHAERLSARGGPAPLAPDPLLFYESSSYGPASLRLLAETVGHGQLLYGSDRPVVDPAEQGIGAGLDWDAVEDATRRALGKAPATAARPVAARPQALCPSQTAGVR
jgi:6-methylsalicylate decarboxylase